MEQCDEVINTLKSYEPFFGVWHIDSLIGRGAFGTVYKIWRSDFGYSSYSALKHVHIGPETFDIELEGRKELEAHYKNIADSYLKKIRIMDRLKGHSNVMSIEDYAVYQGKDGFSWDILLRFELLTPIQEHFAKNPPTEHSILRLGVDICSALELCQRNSIIHGDIKPANLFINSNGDYKLGDFGTAILLSEETAQRDRIGTLSYVAPEVYLNQAYSANTDLYSLGLVLYKYLNENLGPFQSFETVPTAQTIIDSITRRMNGEPLPKPKNASAEFSQIVMKATNFDKASRYQNATEMKQALERLNADSENISFATIPADKHTEAMREEQTIVLSVSGKDQVLPVIGTKESDPKVLSHTTYENETSSAENSGEPPHNHTANEETKSEEDNKHNAEGCNRRIIQRLTNWVLFTCLMSLLPLFVIVLVRALFSINISITNDIASELLYFGLTLSIITLRELILFEETKKESVVFHPALWFTILSLFLSALLFGLMTACELGIFNRATPVWSILLGAIILSGCNFVLGTIIQVWEEL